MTFPTKFAILSFIHFMDRNVAMSWRTTFFSPLPGLALHATTSLPPPLWPSVAQQLSYEVSLGMTPPLIVPMTSLVTAPGEGSFCRKSSFGWTSVFSLATFLRLFHGVPAFAAGAVVFLVLEPLLVLQKF